MAGVFRLVAVAVMVATAGYLVGSLVQSIRKERARKLWANFGLSIAFCSLFFVTWAAQGLAQWRVYVEEQQTHDEPVEIGPFVDEFSQATLENWQSEFLQLFSFTVMASVLIHKGSAESRDSDDSIQAAMKRIEDKLGTEPTLREEPLRQGKSLHVVPDGFEGWVLKNEGSLIPEGYYDRQDEAIVGGRELARQNDVTLFIHGEDGTVREEISK